MSNLKARYVFVSGKTGNTYVLNVQTGPLNNSIPTMGNPNAKGYPIISSAVTVIQSDGESIKYNVPGGKTPFIYNGIWLDAKDSPDGANSPNCAGIDRLFVNFDSNNGNTMLVADTSNTISLVGLKQGDDNATMVYHEFPPQ